jgi:hypothetical protein
MFAVKLLICYLAALAFIFALCAANGKESRDDE